VNDSPLGGVLENDDPSFAVVVDGEIEATVEKEGVAVGPVQLSDRRTTDNSPRITGNCDHVFEDGVVGEEVEEVLAVGDPLSPSSMMWKKGSGP
jgi:hypothetical protein